MSFESSCWIIPVRGTRLVSGYGTRPGRESRVPRLHAGLDFAGRRGEPVRAVTGGQVVWVAENRLSPRGGYGNQVGIYHPDHGGFSFYAHLDRTPDVRPGDEVDPGAVIGSVGNTTNGAFSPMPGEPMAAFRARTGLRTAMGPHLHFEWRRAPRPGAIPFPAGYGQNTVDPQPLFGAVGFRFNPAGVVGTPSTPSYCERPSASELAQFGSAVAAKTPEELAAEQAETTDLEPELNNAPGPRSTLSIPLVLGVGAVCLLGLGAVALSDRRSDRSREG